MNQYTFELLKYIAKHQQVKYNIRLLADTLQISGNTISKLIEECIKENTIQLDHDHLILTSSGFAALEPYRVKRAIVIAAGFGSRMVPVTLDTPKPLVTVNGRRIIDQLIDALHQADIHEIYIVRGYKKEKFDILLDKYPDLIFVDNDEYDQNNNIYSCLKVIDHLDECYICEADLFIDNPNIIEKYQYSSNYLGSYSLETDDWCFKMDRNGYITDYQKGNTYCYNAYGISYWNAEDSKRLRQQLQEVYDQDGHDLFWEFIPLQLKKNDYQVRIRQCQKQDIIEIDNFYELVQLDPSYNDYPNNVLPSNHKLLNIYPEIYSHITQVLHCQKEEITDIIPIKEGLTNTSFRFKIKHEQKEYVYRYPGLNTQLYINRQSEAQSMKIAKELGLDETLIYIDPKIGWKISTYIPHARQLNMQHEQEVYQALDILKTLHQSGQQTEYSFHLMDEANKLIHSLDPNQVDSIASLKSAIEALYHETLQDPIPQVICHNDSYSPNFLLDEENHMYLIDWEYSGTADPGNDIGSFFSTFQGSDEEVIKYLRYYLNNDDTYLQHYIRYIAIASYYWHVWSLYQESLGKHMGEYKNICLASAWRYAKFPYQHEKRS